MIVVIAAFFIILFALGWMDREQQKATLRDQFHLPATLNFAVFKPKNKNNSEPLQGAVRFSESEYHSYIASFANTNIWKNTPLRDRRVTMIGLYSPEALQWSETKPPLRFGSDGLADFGIYEDPKLNQLDNALHFCYAVIRSKTSPAASAPTYAAVSCWELDAREDPSVVVQGVLDPETRTLYMRI